MFPSRHYGNYGALFGNRVNVRARTSLGIRSRKDGVVEGGAENDFTIPVKKRIVKVQGGRTVKLCVCVCERV